MFKLHFAETQVPFLILYTQTQGYPAKRTQEKHTP